MAKRPGAVALVAGALFALSAPTAVAGQESSAPVSGGRADWTPAAGGVSLDVTAPAAPTASGGGSFPALGGTADPRTGAAEVTLGGVARLGEPGRRPLVLAGLRLRLTGEEGALYARTVVDGRARELALAEVAEAEPAVRATGVTWTGLRASLTEEGAALLSDWGGGGFTAGDAFGAFDVTVGTGQGESPVPQASTSAEAEEPPASAPPDKAEDEGSGPAAVVARPVLAAGAEQTVTGAGFAPGAVVLVAIDGDTRYQAVADAEGRFARAFPVYANAAEGEHTVVLTAVGGEQAVAEVRFSVTVGPNSLAP
ncbi:HtaA domain-containing protein [Streptomyces sp. Amel2xC10]|uniref:HtaA domain-containing protein n=1 Tax=Streptomyces sp. Amel2xC10 TaxID=1305826 RepID=UPI000A090DB7|nr:HtaA domain-containing protein [Streptomyces sp. Amel2xC10]SMF02343.1 Htaa protein [Streptomyces sp. Amel2xC10]